MSIARRFLLVGALLLSAGCGDSDKPQADAPDEGKTDEVTYQRSIRPILEQNCTTCHTPGGIGPFALESYADLVPVEGAVVTAVKSRTMPPWHAADDCHPLSGDRRLSDEDVALFQAWSDADFPEGEAETFEARPPLPGVSAIAEEADVVVQMEEGYSAPPSSTDTYQCFVLPYRFEKDTYLTAIDVLPDQRALVHHVQIHTFPESSRANVEGRDDAAPGPGFPCAFALVPGDTNIYSWRPGATAVQMLPGDAMLVTAGTGVYIQVHYNVQGLAVGEQPPLDRSSIKLWTLPEGEKPERVIVRKGLFAGLPPNTLLIPAGESHVVTSSETTGSMLNLVGTSQLEGELVGQTPHMHALGTRLSAKLNRDGEDQCLIDVPNWSFEWQQDYLYPPDQPVKVAATDKVTVTCEYDNSPGHQPLLQGQRITPRDVTWGEGTFDEMCLNYAWMRFDEPAYDAAINGTAAP